MAFKKALDEWDYKKGEIYAVVCANSRYATEGLLIFTVITGQETYNWVAFLINKENINILEHIFD